MSFLFIITEDETNAIVPIIIATIRDLVKSALVEAKFVEIILPILT